MYVTRMYWHWVIQNIKRGIETIYVIYVYEPYTNEICFEPVMFRDYACVQSSAYDILIVRENWDDTSPWVPN